jgi:hypothetical protein
VFLVAWAVVKAAAGTDIMHNPEHDRHSSRPGRVVVCIIQGGGLLMLYSRIVENKVCTFFHSNEPIEYN